MGGCASAPTVDSIQNQQVEKYMTEVRKSWAYESKLLLLGTGDAGKSTILKQIRVINSVPFTPQEVENYRQLIYSNIIGGVRILYDIIREQGIEISDETKEILPSIISATDIKGGQPYPPDHYTSLKQIWTDSGIQTARTYGREYNIPDNLTYYFRYLSRLFTPGYEPTQQDILYARVRTTGVQEAKFVFGKKTVAVIDVGGQRSERKKWIHCFENVTAILFLVSLSGYDQQLVEDNQINQMQDALTTWDAICCSPWFRYTSMILFLNKEDLFTQKVKYSSIKRYFPDYDGKEGDVKAGLEYFKKRFLDIHRHANSRFQDPNVKQSMPKIPAKEVALDERKVYPYFTTATDTKMIKAVMGFVNEIILLDNLAGSHML